jgi:hypothetical protein
MKLSPIVLVAALLFSSALFADDQDPEIDYLLKSIGNSECVFIRNGSRHSAEKAEEHLRMKYERGRRYATSAEAFIERLASKSSMTRKLYMMECPGEEAKPSGEWLTRRLEEFRQGQE